MNKLEVEIIFRRKIMVKIIIAAFLILGFVSAAVASARWKEKDEDEEMKNLEYGTLCICTFFLL